MQDEMAQIEPLLDVKAVATLLGMTPTTVYRKVKAGEIPGIKLGHRTLRFSPEAIRELMKQA